MTLQYKFIESKGKPINYNGTLVLQMVEMQDVFNNLPPIVWRVFADILMGSVSYE